MNALLRCARAMLVVPWFVSLLPAQTGVSFADARAYLGARAAIADFNHDGIPDLIGANLTSGTIDMHAGVGNGTFTGDETLQLALVKGTAVTQLLTTDLNGDGLPDLIVGQDVSPEIVVFLGTASGGFSAAGSYAGPADLINLYIADLNNDGVADLVAADSNDVAVLLGKGNGIFHSEFLVFSQASLGGSAAVADFNGDGNLDLAVPATGGVFIFFGDGTGKFPTGTTFTTTETLSVAAASDLNADGKADLVLEPAQKGLVEVLLGKGNGTFGTPQVYFTGPSSGGATRLAIGDVNGDGVPDIVTSEAAILFGKGDGTFGNARKYPQNASWQSVQLSDLRGIGRLDIIETNAAPPSTSVLLNEGSGKFEDAPAVQVSGLGCGAVADFNGDGHDDVAAITATGIEILLGTGEQKGSLQPFGAFSVQGAQCLVAGDFNGDGFVDIVVNSSNGNLAFFAGLGNGKFSQPIVTILSTPLFAVVTGDFNGDGHLDLAAFENSETIAVLFGDGTGKFEDPVVTKTTNNLQGIAAADLNNDGLADLVAYSIQPSIMTVLLNSGNAAFRTQTFSSTEYLEGVQVADLNGDRIPDIVLIGATSVYTYLGDGGGLFTQTSQLAAAGASCAIADVNGDGIPDLALDDTAEVMIFLGDGTGAFSYPGEPNGLWFAVPGESSGGKTQIATVYLQSQSPSSGFADFLNFGLTAGGGYIGELLNQAVTAPGSKPLQ